MISLFTTLLPSLFKLGDKMIVDEDKKADFAFRVQEMAFKQMETLINAKTYPFVDALVKLAYASEQIVKGLFRPLGAAALTGFVVYAEIKGITLSPTVETILVGMFPGWMYSRHKDKAQEKKKESIDPWEDDED